ncbi:unnamed protein product [Triticum turgidum subsp. durum]|uniref:MATH domain-containing protein n=1 Tax=Triticum turgidum subsp. durum TaxID=4567 RepID=A0A9R0ZJU6_TRITD|nr:unnamed protein product [Triticum turgidum subsp. durum]
MVSMKLPPQPTRSTITATTSAGTHELKGEGYSVTKLLVAGEHIESSKFRAAGHDFQICYYPHRYQKKDCNASISFLKMAEAVASNVRVEFRFSLVSRHGGEPARFAGQRRVVTFPDKHDGVEYWGLEISKKELEQSPEYLWDDSFVLRCEITVVDKPVVKSHDGLAVCRCKDDLCKRRHLRNTADRASWVKDVVVKHFLRCVGI